MSFLGRQCPAFASALLGISCVVLPLSGKEPGTIVGVVDKPARVQKVVAVDRRTDRKVPAVIDSKTGSFVIENLAVDTDYDLIFDLDGSRLEGVNLKVPRSDYEEEQPLSSEDRDTLRSTAKSLNKFEDQVEILAIEGNIMHAAVLMNKRRTQAFYESKAGEMIWRLELWHFERPEETWVKSQDELFLVLYRERLSKAVYEKKALTLDPALGGLRPSGKQARIEVGKVKLPGSEPGIRLRGTRTEGGKVRPEETPASLKAGKEKP